VAIMGMKVACIQAASTIALVVATLSVLVPALAAAQRGERRAVESLLELRQDKVVVQKWDLSCGAAALATLLTYQHGDPVPERAIARGLIRRQEYLADPSRVGQQGGFSLLDLKRYVDHRGYEGSGYGRLKFSNLIALAPLIVPLSLNGYDHFVVFRGVWGERVLLADPGWGDRTMTIERFENAWLDFPKFGKVGFVVERRDGREPPNRLAPEPNDFLVLPRPMARVGAR
jgi:uncharacterized protein